MIERMTAHAPEIRPDGMVLFPEVLGRFLTDQIAEAHVSVLSQTHRGYLRQKEVEFYPVDMTEEEWQEALRKDERLAMNNTLVSRRWKPLFTSRGLEAISYLDRGSGFRDIHLAIADSLDHLSRLYLGLPDEDLVRSVNEILARGFRTGDTDEAMRDFINLRTLPRYSIGAFLQERLLDKTRNLKFAYEGWSSEENRYLSARFNVWAWRLLLDVGKPSDSQFIVCDSAGQAGIATEFIWQGNTMPSQTEIGMTFGHKIFFFDNVSVWKAAKYIEPKLRVITPPSILDRMNNGSFDKVRRAVIAGHEVGHAAQKIPEGADLRLGRWYQTVKELYADAFALWAIFRRPEIIITRDDIIPAVYFDVARHLTKIEEYKMRVVEEGKDARDVIDPYPYSAAIKLNTLIEQGALTFQGDTYFVVDRDDLRVIRKVIEGYITELDKLIVGGTQIEAEDFIKSRSSTPVDYLAPVLPK